MDKIIITRDLDIRFSDFCKTVDFSHPFTLRTIINIATHSCTIPVEIMEEILNCRYLWEYYEESLRPKSEKKWTSEIEYLEVYFDCSKSTYEGITESSSMWSFHGLGKKGVMEDAELRGVDKIDTEFRENYAVELTPVNELADLEIRIRPEMVFNDSDEKDYNKAIVKMPYTPSITLIELLHAIFWELSWFGSPKKRDDESEMLKGRVDEIKKAKENGTIDKITVPWENVKARIEKMLEKNKRRQGIKSLWAQIDNKEWK